MKSGGVGLLNVIKNADKILEGVINEVKSEFNMLPEEDQEIITERRFICETCPFNSKNAIKDGWYNSVRPDDHCTMCSCNIKAKTACLSCKCGIDAHNKTNQENLELKWYEKQIKGGDSDGTTDSL